MSTLDKLSPALRQKPAVRELARKVDTQRSALSRMRERSKGPGTVATLATNSVASFAAGVADAVAPPVMGVRPSLGLSLASLGLAFALRSPLAVQACAAFAGPSFYELGVNTVAGPDEGGVEG